MNDAFARLFANQPRIPVIPYISSFSTKVSGVSVKEFMNSAALLSKGVSDTQRLLGYDAVLNIFDTTLEAEALGCQVDWGDGYQVPRVVSHPLSEGKVLSDKDVASLDQKGRVPLVVDATRRLATLTQNRAVLIGTLTGPFTLAAHLIGHSFSARLEDDREETQKVLSLCASVSTKVARALCDAKAKAVMVVEETLPMLNPQEIRRLLGSLRPLSNVLHYYDVPSILLARGCTQEVAHEICKSGLSCYSISGDFALPNLRTWASDHDFCYGGAVPTHMLNSTLNSGRTVRELIREGLGKGFFISTEWEVPAETEMVVIREIVSEAKLPRNDI